MTNTTTNNTEPCHTCGGEYNCPDCGVWLTREDYDDSRAFHETVGALPPALTRILSEEAAPAEAAPVDAPAPTDPRDAEIEALRSEVAALREMRQRITSHIEGVLRYENVGPTEFFRGACGAYKTVLGIITRTNSTPVES